MSNSGNDKSAGASSPTIGYRFHTKSEELGELQGESSIHDTEINAKGYTKTDDSVTKPKLLTSSSLDSAKSREDKNEVLGETVKDYWGLLGRSINADSSYESPFSNPIETWRKLNELKGKITKTVEDKLSEMKMNCNVSSHSKLINSKDNSSISDSEDTSESSKLSEQWKDAEDLNLSLKKVINKTTDNLNAALQNVKSEMEVEAELRNRKSHAKLSDPIKIHDIKIVTAKSDNDSCLNEENFPEEVESGVEADEHFDSTSIETFGEQVLQEVGGSQTPLDGDGTLQKLYYMFKQSGVLAAVLLIGFSLYLLTPMSDFMRGFTFCLILVYFILKLNNYFQDDDSLYIQQLPFAMPDYKNLPPLKVPKYKHVTGVWVNEYLRETYDPDYYSVSQTLPAYLELEHSILKLSRPKGKINKRATFDEPEYKLQFISRRIYNISGCNVFLLPEGLTRKRLFSKKYPIVIFLRPDSFIGHKVGENADDKEGQETAEEDDVNFNTTVSSVSRSSLYLFARCDRQKEEWYRKLLAATRLTDSTVPAEETIPEGVSKVSLKESSTPFENVVFDAEVALVEEYLRYMAQFVDCTDVIFPEKKKSVLREAVPSSSSKKKRSKKKDCPGTDESVEHVNSVTMCKKGKNAGVSLVHLNEEPDSEDNVDTYPQIQWFNAFLNRILFDMFRSPYWLAKIHEKVYKKLNSIRLPYYVEEIELIEMDLGKTGPMFHRVSPPYVDERGLWFDMDTTFEGLIKLTIQTHLNLIKLQQGMKDMQEMNNILEKTEKEKKKEVRDHFSNKESIEKSKENVNRTNKKLEKEISPHSESAVVEPNQRPKFKGRSKKRRKSSEMKLLSEVTQIAELAAEEGIQKTSTTRSPIYDSDVEDSAESSEDDIEEEEEEEISATLAPTPAESEEPSHVSIARRYPKNRRSSKKLFRMFENVAQSKYFKTVASSKYVQRAIAGVSATKLCLTLEIRSCSGILAVNVPPPPSDRFWYGFREMPKLCFSAHPKIGTKSVKFSHIKKYLQKKILHEIKKAMVVPNMIDFVLFSSVPESNPSGSQQTEEEFMVPEDREPTSSD